MNHSFLKIKACRVLRLTKGGKIPYPSGMKKIGIIGYGNMGAAIAAGLKKRIKDIRIGITEIRKDKAASAKDSHGVEVFAGNSELLAFADICVIAVKPQELPALFAEIRDAAKDKRIISIAAGKKIDIFTKALNTPYVARFMPNLAATEGKALVGIAYSDRADDTFKADCQLVANAIGTPCEVPENLMSAITGLSGSGIAYVFAFVHAMALGGVASGIGYAKSVEIALATLEGAVAVMRSSGQNPVEMLSRVISPAGTTIEGVSFLEKSGFTYAVMKAVEKASKKAGSMENN
jgi:pyrroline-5-carboxylate reductase